MKGELGTCWQGYANIARLKPSSGMESGRYKLRRRSATCCGRAASTPGTKARDKDDDNDIELGRPEAKEFRSLAARANFMAIDRADVQYAVKEICRRMSKPCKGDWDGMKHLARYLFGKRRMERSE